MPKAQVGAPEQIGDLIPSNTDLYVMPSALAEKVPQAKSHKFYVIADAIVLVSPSDRKVAVSSKLLMREVNSV